MNYHWIEMILNFISSISWPLVCFIIITYFKKPISRFLKRVQKVSYGDASIERQVKKQRDEKIENDILQKGKDFTYIDETLHKFSETSREFALQVIENEVKISEVEDDQQRSERLLKYSQLLIIIKNAERIYRLIYGSQIRLLQKLNYASEKSEDVKYFYDSAVEFFPDIYQNYSYQSYLDFLVSQRLISFDKENDLLIIKEEGRDFLRYLTESNSQIEKLY